MSHRDASSTLIEGIGSRKQRGGVAVISHAQHHQIKVRPFARCSTGHRPKLVLILPCGNSWIWMLSSHTVNLVLPNVKWTKERFFSQAEIAVGSVGRHTAFIAEEEIGARPLLAVRRYGS